LRARRAVYALAVIAIIVVATFAVYEEYIAPPASTCAPIQGGRSDVARLSGTTFGAVTEYQLPSQGRWPTAITSSPDGSIWFVEQELPGVGHFFPQNATLVEYAWPGYAAPKPPNCEPQASSSGIALWNGRVWAADQFGNAILGLNPADGSVVNYSTASKADFPYWLAVGPGGNLWFASDYTPPRLGEIFPNGTISVVNLSGLAQEFPLQVKFVNSTLGFITALNLTAVSSSNTCVCNGHIYSFDPSRVAATISPSLVGGNFQLILPTSVAYSDGRIWVAQHGTSRVASYDFATKDWTTWPTTTVPWSATYPYYAVSSGGTLWFNEHYANKIATIDPLKGTMTEYSESNPPASSNAGIQNDEYDALAGGDLWFTSMSGNYIGFVNGSYAPSFQVGAVGNSSAEIAAGEGASFTLRVSGEWSTPLQVNVSDSENYSSVPSEIAVTTGVAAVPTGASPFDLGVTVRTDSSLAPGRYTVAVTLTDAGVQQAAFLFLDVT
jgi:streptogramin lyase